MGDLLFFCGLIMAICFIFVQIMKMILYRQAPIASLQIPDGKGERKFREESETINKTFLHSDQDTQRIVKEMISYEIQKCIFAGIVSVGFIFLCVITAMYFWKRNHLIDDEIQVVRQLMLIQGCIGIVVAVMCIAYVVFLVYDGMKQTQQIIKISESLDNKPVINCQDFIAKNKLTSSSMRCFLKGLESLQKKFINEERFPCAYVYSVNEDGSRHLEYILLSQEAKNAFFKLETQE